MKTYTSRSANWNPCGTEQIPADMDSETGAVFSPDRVYRYALWRNWAPIGKRVLFVGLNPSTADETHNDPTIRRCIGFARSWGCSGIAVGNLFGFRATRPAALKKASDPVGEHNREWLATMSQVLDLTIVCWGNHGRFMQQDHSVIPLLVNPHCLQLNSSGTPAHPLYLKKTLFPKSFTDPAA